MSNPFFRKGKSNKLHPADVLALVLMFGLAAISAYLIVIKVMFGFILFGFSLGIGIGMAIARWGDDLEQDVINHINQKNE